MSANPPSAVCKFCRFRFTPPFGDVVRGLVYPVPLCRGDTHCYTVSISHAGAAPPPRLLALHVPHRARCCDAPPEPRDRDLPRPPPRSGTATTPPRPGGGRPIAPAGLEHARAGSRGQQEAAAQEIETRPATHLATSASSDDSCALPRAPNSRAASRPL